MTAVKVSENQFCHNWNAKTSTSNCHSTQLHFSGTSPQIQGGQQMGKPSPRPLPSDGRGRNAGTEAATPGFLVLNCDRLLSEKNKKAGLSPGLKAHLTTRTALNRHSMRRRRFTPISHTRPDYCIYAALTRLYPIAF